MADKCNAKLFILVDAAGDCVVGTSEAAAREAYENDVQGPNECDGFRPVKVCVKVSLPTIPELIGEAPVEGEAVLSSVA